MSAAEQVLAAWEKCDKIDTLFVLVCCVFCWPIIIAVGFAYSGYSTRKNSLASFYPAILAIAVCSIQWWFIGYSFAYGVGNGFIGGFEYVFHRNVLSEPVGTIPAILFSFFQVIFEATVCAIAIGGACERGRILPLIPFIALWATFVYCPLAHMVWASNGFLADLGVLDFAGGTPVHICSGATATALSVYLSRPLARSARSKERTPSHLVLHKPHNTLNQALALVVIWGSWLAFDAGTTLAFNFKSVMAMVVTNICAASGAMTWALMTFAETGRWSLDSVFLGAIAGLVMITPSAGFIGQTTAFFFGITGAVVFRQALRIKFSGRAHSLRWVDAGDTFATHCIGGILGTIMTGMFASKEIAAYDGFSDISGGAFIDGNLRQIGVQIVEAGIGFSWAFGVSYLIYALIDCVPGLEVLATDEEIEKGMDAAQMEESFSDRAWADEIDYVPFAVDQGVRLYITLAHTSDLHDIRIHSTSRPPTPSLSSTEAATLELVGIANISPPTAKLDFDARVPIPFSVFPSSYKNETTETAEVKSEERITVEGPGRDERRETRRQDIRIVEEDRRRPVKITREEEIRVHDHDRHHRDTRYEFEREHYSQPFRRYANAQIDVEDHVVEKDEERLDTTEREYRSRVQEAPVWQDKSSYPRQYDEKVTVRERHTFEEPEHKHKRDMGYYDDEGHYHSFRRGLEKAADRILHPIHGSEHRHHHHHHHDDLVIEKEVTVSAPRHSETTTVVEARKNKMSSSNSITIPCHHVRIGDLLILQGRPCQVIRITTSAQTGQHRYLGVDLFTKQLHEESSFVSNPSPSVYVQNMLGPVFKQYRVLDITDAGRIVAMTESGDIKQGLRVLDQSELLKKVTKAYDSGRGSIRVLVINDEGRELAVDYRVVHGSRL